MSATRFRCLATAVAALSFLGVSSCYYDAAPPPPVGALGPAPSEASGSHSSAHHEGRTDEETSHRAPDLEGDYPKGYKTDKPHQVISPFKPHNLIDISENPKTGQPFRSGDLVKDPSNDQIFRIP